VIYKRFFAFGCSFTDFYWPTWADVLGKEFPVDCYHNFGLCAAGNEFVFHRLTEVHARYNIGPDDLVIVCWTNFAREDRYINGAWKPAGNIFTQNVYPKKWVKEWFDLRGALLKTSSVIAATTHLLESTNCEFHFTSMMPLTEINSKDSIFAELDYKDIFTVYKPYYDRVKISMVEHLFNSLPYCRNPNPAIVKYKETDKKYYADNHPNPVQHLQYTEEILIPALASKITISDKTKDWVSQWNHKIYSSKPYFKCSEDGWSFAYRYSKHHAHLC
jgi:hypothetical protein